MKRLPVIIGLLLFIVAASAQFTVTGSEDFEDDTVGDMVCGSNPDEPWYSISITDASSNTCTAAQLQLAEVTTTDPIAGSQSFAYTPATATPGFVTFGMTPVTAYPFMELSHEIHDTTSDQFIRFNGPSSTLIGSIYYDVSLGQICLTDVAFPRDCSAPTSEVLVTIDLLGNRNFDITFNWTAKTWTVELPGIPVSATRAFQNNLAETLEAIQFDPGTAPDGVRLWTLDTFLVYEDVPDNPDPTEDTEPPFEGRPVEPGGIFGDNGAAFGGNKSALAATMEISVTALEIGMAILWILLFTAIGFLVFNRSMAGALSGGLGGVVWSIAWGLIPLWFVFMLIILTGAGLLLLRRRA